MQCALLSLIVVQSVPVLLCSLFHKPPPYPPGKAPVNVLKEQVLFLPLYQNRKTISGEVVIG
jgi:hypothetical protein